MLACYRYIEMNPVRAEMVKHPRHYRWSSYRINAEGQASKVITQHQHYRVLGRSEEARREAYWALFKTELDPEVLGNIRAATNGNYALGSRRFEAEVAAMVGRRVTRARQGALRRTRPLPKAEICSVRIRV